MSDSIEADVVVFGAGVTGLTVAHELAERNFKIVVVEPDFEYTPSPYAAVDAQNPGLGGVARSQWGYIHFDKWMETEVETPCPPGDMIEARSLLEDPRDIVISYQREGESFSFTATPPSESDPGFLPARALRPFLQALIEVPDSRISCFHSRHRDYPHTDIEDFLPSLIEHLVGVSAIELTRDELAQVMDPLRYDVFEAPNGAGSVTLAMNLFVLPGEHGFRFFPSFYRHIFDTMRRIPVMMQVAQAPDPAEPEPKLTHVRRGRDTVFDNLVSVGSVGYVGNADGPSAKVYRRAIRSNAEVREMLRDLVRETGYTETDLMRLSLKVIKYITSSKVRREREYEDISWFDFVEGDRFSTRGRFLSETMPGTLGGLFGSDSDARTQGTVMLQCMMDQFSDTAQSDKLLNGPTDEAWFSHWYRYLTTQGVRFIKGKLDGFSELNGVVQPIVKDGERLIDFAPVPREGDCGNLGKRVHFVMALPLTEAHRLSGSFIDAARKASPGVTLRDFGALYDFPQRTPAELAAELERDYPAGPLRHLSGIQFFFKQDVRLLSSHTLYIDAPSGLTAVAQPQFWWTPRDNKSGYRGVISVDIGIWGPRAGVPKAPWYPWKSSRKDIATKIWQQIEEAHRGDHPGWTSLPKPIAFHIDHGLVFRDGLLAGDRTPFQVNERSRFRARPGGVKDPETGEHVGIEYDVALGSFVLAGTFMQTFTRINSMEAACESGRHAVNALLRHIDFKGEGCSVWDPEDHEPGFAADLREIDEDLCLRGMPHMVDILGAHALDAWAWPGTGRFQSPLRK